MNCSTLDKIVIPQTICLKSLFKLQNIIKVIKSRRMRGQVMYSYVWERWEMHTQF